MAKEAALAGHHVTLETVASLPDWWQTEIHAMAKRMGFELASENEPGSWRCELDGYWWRARNGQ